MAALVATAFLSPAAFAQAVDPPGRAAPSSSTPSGVSQSLAIETTIRRYRVADIDVAEQVAPITYRLTSGRASLRLGVGPVAFTGDATRIRGSTPAAGRFDYRLDGGRSLRLYGQSASRPGALDDAQTSAIGAAGTPTLDLESFSFGTPASIGGRLTQDMTMGVASIAVHGAFEVEPRPSGTLPVYWRGKTARVGATVSTSVGEAKLSGGVEVSRSVADALDGRNLFPGGGSLSLSATGSGAFSEDSDTLWQLFGFYFRPLNSSRPDQPNRLLPVGDFMGVHGSVAVPLGLWLVWPALDVMREASHTVTESAGVNDRVDGSGWTTNLGVQVTLPVPGRVDVTPGVGVVRGSLGASVTSTTRGIASQDSFSDPIRGWWASLELSGRF